MNEIIKEQMKIVGNVYDQAFNEGYEKAQKEFLDFLVEYLKDEGSEMCDCHICMKIKNKIKELEAKTK